MLTILSPAKTLDFQSEPTTDVQTTPEFLRESAALVDVLKTLTPKQLGALMGISDSLAELNHQRYQDWQQPMPEVATKQAVLAFKGDVYRGLEADQWTEKQLLYAQDHLRILSGLYGVLRPLDQMLPYRLEMGTALETPRGKDLYAFWGGRITEALNRQLGATGSKVLLNLASGEYFRAVRPDEVEASVVSPVFKDKTKGKYRVVAVYAKKARGQMASWVIRNRVKTTRKLQRYDIDGYRYDESASTETEPVFLRG
jgi:cytoplasmic iron level regulating protein YaaA (DUF328/UPF0246 family)